MGRSIRGGCLPGPQASLFRRLMSFGLRGLSQLLSHWSRISHRKALTIRRPGKGLDKEGAVNTGLYSIHELDIQNQGCNKYISKVII